MLPCWIFCGAGLCGWRETVCGSRTVLWWLLFLRRMHRYLQVMPDSSGCMQRPHLRGRRELCGLLAPRVPWL